jgi:thiol-disulfide isomerase/thioredoxin
MRGIAKVLLVIFAFLMVTVAPCWSVEVGEAMPEFAVQTFDGNVSSRAALAGKPLLLIFWNTWCPNCMRELPKINALAKEFSPRGLAVLAVNTAINDNERKARAYWQEQGFVFSSGFDDYFEIGQAFAVRGVPTIFLFDSKGVARYKHTLIPVDMEERFRQLIVKE